MIIKEVTDLLEALAPLDNAEDFDNVGLLVGDASDEVSGILVTLDTLENVVDEAIEKNCNLIVSFHPIIFTGLKKITGSDYVQRTVIKAIRNRISIYSMHTALDNSPLGVNARICQTLGLEDPRILIPKNGSIKKLTTYVPRANADKLKGALWNAGAGQIGDYSHCSFSVEGTGTFMAGAEANPSKGNKGELHTEEETQVHVTFTHDRERSVLKALQENHPYEEVAYEVYSLENSNQHLGMGMIGSLSVAMTEKDFIELVKERMGVQFVRHSALLNKKVKKIAVLGGSGGFAIGSAKKAGADIFLTADLKYHQFFTAENKILLLDIGHYESEQFTKNLLVEYLTKKIPNFAIALSESVTNPINYS